MAESGKGRKTELLGGSFGCHVGIVTWGIFHLQPFTRDLSLNNLSRYFLQISIKNNTEK